MINFRVLITVTVIMFALMICGCPKDKGPGSGEHAHSHEPGVEHNHGEEDSPGGEHDRDGQEHHSEEGEESGAEIALGEAYNATRNGAQLYLAYNKQSNLFSGWVKNNTNQTLEQVRVEVHLSNGKELGPTTPTDLEPGKRIDVELKATSTDFTGWTAHPEVGSGEHGHEGHDHEHGEQGHEH